jgi:hypothetical protein
MHSNRIDRRLFIKALSALGSIALVRSAASQQKPRTGLARSPQMAIDGFLEAPIGSAQYPNYFTSLNGISPYPVRPPWRVAGVDYRVGINAGVSLKDPTFIDAAIATRSGKSPILLSLQQDDVVLDGYDFTLGGWWQIRSNGHSNLTVSNSKLVSLCLDIDRGPLTVQYCEIDGLGVAGEAVFGCLAFLRAGVTSKWRYNWLYNALNDFIDLNTADIDARFNLFDTMGYGVGAHADAIQFAGDGAANKIKLLFNTYVHTALTSSGPSSFIDLETQAGTNLLMNGPEVAYNTASYTVRGAAPGGIFFRIGNAAGGAVNGAFVHENYADPKNMSGAIWDRSPGTNYRKQGNVLLTSGREF